MVRHSLSYWPFWERGRLVALSFASRAVDGGLGSPSDLCGSRQLAPSVWNWSSSRPSFLPHLAPLAPRVLVSRVNKARGPHVSYWSGYDCISYPGWGPELRPCRKQSGLGVSNQLSARRSGTKTYRATVGGVLPLPRAPR